MMIQWIQHVCLESFAIMINILYRILFDLLRYTFWTHIFYNPLTKINMQQYLEGYI